MVRSADLMVLGWPSTGSECVLPLSARWHREQVHRLLWVTFGYTVSYDSLHASCRHCLADLLQNVKYRRADGASPSWPASRADCCDAAKQADEAADDRGNRPMLVVIWWGSEFVICLLRNIVRNGSCFCSQTYRLNCRPAGGGDDCWQRGWQRQLMPSGCWHKGWQWSALRADKHWSATRMTVQLADSPFNFWPAGGEDGCWQKGWQRDGKWSAARREGTRMASGRSGWTTAECWDPVKAGGSATQSARRCLPFDDRYPDDYGSCHEKGTASSPHSARWFQSQSSFNPRRRMLSVWVLDWDRPSIQSQSAFPRITRNGFCSVQSRVNFLYTVRLSTELQSVVSEFRLKTVQNGWEWIKHFVSMMRV